MSGSVRRSVLQVLCGNLRMEIVFDYTSKDFAASADQESGRVARFVACMQTYIGHELPNQLVAIQAFARMLLEHHGSALDEEARMMLARMASLTQRTDAVARRLAEVGRLLRDSAWGLPLSLDEVVREAIAEVNALGAPPDCTFDVEENLPTVYASRRLLHQVLVQLLKNAVEALAGQTGSVIIGGKRETGGVSLWVRDTGRGMSESQTGLFEPFAAGRFPGAKGTGLGLFLVCQAVARWGGSLHVRSQPGKGSTFTFFLPNREVEYTWTS
jgi:signal transduction histidine kinase